MFAAVYSSNIFLLFTGICIFTWRPYGSSVGGVSPGTSRPCPPRSTPAWRIMCRLSGGRVLAHGGPELVQQA